jgi:sulfate permease, SulP family
VIPRQPPPRGAWARILAARTSVGIVIGGMQVVMALSAASVLFSGVLASELATGIGALLWGTAVIAFVTAWKAYLPGTAAITQSSIAAVIAVTAAALATAWPAETPAETVTATLFAFVVLTTLLVGVTLTLAGTLRLGRFVRYVPYPVVGGFVAGTGWLLVSGGIRAMTGIPLRLGTLAELLAPTHLVQWLPGLLLGLLALIATRTLRHPLTLPAVLAASTGAFFLLAALEGMPLEAWRARGLLLGPFDGIAIRPLFPTELAGADLGLLVPGIAGAATATLVALLSTLFNTSALEHASGRRIDVDHELRVGGAGNLLATLVGGSPGYQALAVTLVNHGLAGMQRTSAYAALGVIALTLALGDGFLELVPTLLVGGVLVYLGVSFLHDWLVTALGFLSRLEYGIVVAILLATMTFGFVPAVALGLVLAVVLFVGTYSRIDAARSVLSGAVARSRVRWGPRQQRLLTERGERLLVLQLQGFLFFGSASHLVQRIERRQAEEPPLTTVILDLQGVAGMDATAAAAIARLARGTAGPAVHLSGVRPSARIQLLRAGLPAQTHTHGSLDEALEEAERATLGADVDADAGDVLDRLATWEEGGIELHGLLETLERRELPPGATVVRQGDPSDALVFLAQGQLTALLERPEGPPIRLERMHAGALVGEIGFYTGAGRGASVVADRESVVYVLHRERLAELERTDPERAGALHRVVAKHLAARATHLQGIVTALLR